MATNQENLIIVASTQGFDAAARDQTRLANASAAAGRSFAAQSKGLGGLVGAYAGAAATTFALQQAFSALNSVASFENLIKGSRSLGSAIGESGDQILASIKNITKEQVSLADAAKNANLALSSGFNSKQIGDLASIATRASRTLGRDLNDSLTRLTRGTAKLEPELLDELGILTRIDPAVQKYAQSVNKSVASLTQFERSQAFVNAVIEEGNRKFASIDVSAESAQESLNRLQARFTDMTQYVGSFLADGLKPVADYISGSFTNSLFVLLNVGGLVFSKLRHIAVENLEGISKKISTFALDRAFKKVDTSKLADSLAPAKDILSRDRLSRDTISDTNTRRLITQLRDSPITERDVTKVRTVYNEVGKELANVTRQAAQLKPLMDNSAELGRFEAALKKAKLPQTFALTTVELEKSEAAVTKLTSTIAAINPNKFANEARAAFAPLSKGLFTSENLTAFSSQFNNIIKSAETRIKQLKRDIGTRQIIDRRIDPALTQQLAVEEAQLAHIKQLRSDMSKFGVDAIAAQERSVALQTEAAKAVKGLNVASLQNLDSVKLTNEQYTRMNQLLGDISQKKLTAAGAKELSGIISVQQQRIESELQRLNALAQPTGDEKRRANALGRRGSELSAVQVGLKAIIDETPAGLEKTIKQTEKLAAAVTKVGNAISNAIRLLSNAIIWITLAKLAFDFLDMIFEKITGFSVGDMIGEWITDNLIKPLQQAYKESQRFTQGVKGIAAAYLELTGEISRLKDLGVSEKGIGQIPQIAANVVGKVRGQQRDFETAVTQGLIKPDFIDEGRKYIDTKALEDVEKRIGVLSNNLASELGKAFEDQNREKIEKFRVELAALKAVTENFEAFKIADFIGELAEKTGASATEFGKLAKAGTLALSANRKNVELLIEGQKYIVATQDKRGVLKSTGVVQEAAVDLERLNQAVDELVKGDVSSERLSQVVAGQRKRLLDIEKELASARVGEATEVQAILQAETKRVIINEKLRDRLKAAEDIAKNLNDIYGGDIKKLETAIEQGAINLTGGFAQTAEEEAKNRVAFLDTLIKKGRDLELKKGFTKERLSPEQEKIIQAGATAQRALAGRLVTNLQLIREALRQETEKTRQLEAQLDIINQQNAAARLEQQLEETNAVNKYAIDLAQQRLNLQIKQNDLVQEEAKLRIAQNDRVIKQKEAEIETLQVISQLEESRLARQVQQINNTKNERLFRVEQQKVEQQNFPGLYNEKEARDLDIKAAQAELDAATQVAEKTIANINITTDRQLAALGLEGEIISKQLRSNEIQLEALAKKAGDDQARLAAEKQIADLEIQSRKEALEIEKQLALARFEVAAAQLDNDKESKLFELNLLKEKYGFLEAEAKIFEDHATELGKIFIADLDERAKLLDKELTPGVESKFKPDVNTAIERIRSGRERLDSTVDRQKDIVKETYNAQVKAADNLFRHQTRLSDLELDALRKKETLNNQIYEIDQRLAAIQNQTQSEALKAEEETLIARRSNLILQRETVLEDAQTKIEAQKELERDAQRRLELAKQNRDALNQTFRLLASDISQILKDDLGRGLQELTVDVINGTKSIHDAFYDMINNIIVDIQKAVAKRLITDPITENIGKLFRNILGDKEKDSTTKDAKNVVDVILDKNKSPATNTKNLCCDKVSDSIDELKKGFLTDGLNSEDTVLNLPEGFLTDSLDEIPDIVQESMDDTFNGLPDLFASGIDTSFKDLPDIFSTSLDDNFGNMPSIFENSLDNLVEDISGLFDGIASSLSRTLSGTGGSGDMGGGGFGLDWLTSLFGGGSATGGVGGATTLAATDLPMEWMSYAAFLASGGSVRKFTSGGRNPRDSVPAMLEPGEYVVRKVAADRIGHANLNRLNATGSVEHLASGGPISHSAMKDSEPHIIKNIIEPQDSVSKFAEGGSVRHFASGGPVFGNTVPSLAPSDLEMRNYTPNGQVSQSSPSPSSSSTTPVVVNITNKGTPQTPAQNPTQTFDGEKYVVDIILRDMENNGPIRKSIRTNR